MHSPGIVLSKKDKEEEEVKQEEVEEERVDIWKRSWPIITLTTSSCDQKHKHAHRRTWRSWSTTGVYQMGHKHFIEPKFISASPPVILSRCRSGIYSIKNGRTPIYWLHGVNKLLMGGKGHEQATSYQAEVGQVIMAARRWRGGDRWRGTDELRFDEVLMTHLVDPSGGPTAPGPAVETIELLQREKYDETENRLGHAQIIQLLKFCLRTYFTFDGTIYELMKGTPMSSPISGPITEAVLQRLESLVFRHHRPEFSARYVDDTFVVIERDQVLTFKEHLNAIFPDIQFTMEEEENNQLAFLDVLVCRKDCGGLKNKVFRITKNTMQILNFNSNHPISHTRSCVRALYRRVETHCSEMEYKVAELKYLRRAMRANGYSRNFVNQCIRKRHQRPNPTAPHFGGLLRT
ncbi:hypothetical protein SprV_0100509300 [Sparganum proliferum]